MSKINIHDLPLLKELNEEQASAVYGGTGSIDPIVVPSLIASILTATQINFCFGLGASSPGPTQPDDSSQGTDSNNDYISNSSWDYGNSNTDYV